MLPLDLVTHCYAKNTVHPIILLYQYTIYCYNITSEDNLDDR